MNFLTHSALVMDALPLSGAARDLSIIGAVAPDLAGRLRLRRAGHQRGLELLDYVKSNAPQWMPFALGLITHGNSPGGVDAASHGPEGIISSIVTPLAEQAEKNPDFHKIFRQTVWWHLLVELVFDHLLLRDRPEIVRQVTGAFHNADLARAAEIYAESFDLDGETVKTNFMRLRKWNLDYYLDSGKYHFIFHRVWQRLKRGEGVPAPAFEMAFDAAREKIEPMMPEMYESLLGAARAALEAVDYRNLIQP